MIPGDRVAEFVDGPDFDGIIEVERLSSALIYRVSSSAGMSGPGKAPNTFEQAPHARTSTLLVPDDTTPEETPTSLRFWPHCGHNG